MTSQQPPKSVVARALAVLSAFSVRQPSLSLSEISRSTGLPVATVYRLLGELEEGRFVQRGPGGKYQLGLKLWEMGLLTPVHGHVRETAMPFLLNLHYRTRETVQFAVIDGLTGLYVEKLTSEESVPAESRIGARLPLHATGVGKALLAFSDETYRQAVLAEPLERYTANTFADPGALTTELDAIRARGWSTSFQEYLGGASSIAAPVLVDGEVRAAVGLVNYALDAQLERHIEPLLHAANGIGRRLEQMAGLDFPTITGVAEYSDPGTG